MRGPNAFWQIAYHTLFYTHLYLHRDEASFQPWAGHQSGVRNATGLIARHPTDPSLPAFPNPYSKAQVLAFWAVCDAMIDETIDALDLEAPECGFWWYRMSKLEHQFVNIRHVQHHTAQLADRLRASQDVGVEWVGRQRA